MLPTNLAHRTATRANLMLEVVGQGRVRRGDYLAWYMIIANGDHLPLTGPDQVIMAWLVEHAQVHVAHGVAYPGPGGPVPPEGRGPGAPHSMFPVVAPPEAAEAGE